MPVVHALLQVREEIERVVPGLSQTEVWARPGGAASVAFHLVHLAGSLDRLLTYARGEALSATQRESLDAEERAGEAVQSAVALLRLAREAIDAAVAEVRQTPIATLTDGRLVGRSALPSTVGGLLFHAAEHAQRHAGQFVTTVKVIRGLGLS